MIARDFGLSVNQPAAPEWTTWGPSSTAARMIATPIRLPSTTRPGRIRYMYHPKRSAAGIVIATVKVPHGELARAFTTTIPSPARRRIVMKRIAAVAALCATGPISRRDISESEAALWRTDANRMMKSWTAPPRAAPNRIQRAPGRYPNCAARTGPMRGPDAEIAAK
jgi:hypothetical protein